MKKPSQLALPGFTPRTTHGGDLRKGRRKLARPIDPKRAMHVTFKSSRARGEYSLLHPRNSRQVTGILYRAAYRNGVELKQVGNSGNHVHLLLKGRTRKAIQDFLREAAGQIAQKILRAKKGQAKGRFWDALAFSRVVERGCDETIVSRYVIKNLIEGLTGWQRGSYRIFGRAGPEGPHLTTSPPRQGPNP